MATLTVTTVATAAFAALTTPIVAATLTVPEVDVAAGAVLFTQNTPIVLLPDSAMSGTAILLGLAPSASIDTSPPNFTPANIETHTPRLMAQVSITHSTPFIARGKPYLPRFSARYPSTMTATEGPSDIHSIPDPDPVWDPGSAGWFTPPIVSTAGDARWTVNSLPDPAGFPGQFYWLGAPSSLDGTSSIATACRQWAPDPSTPTMPNWNSVYPYKPSVRAHVNYGANGKILTIGRGVRFNLQFIEHMWLDWGSQIGAPFTWVIVGLIMDFPTGVYEHTILDVGRSPTDGGAPTLNENQLAGSRPINDFVQTYRPGLLISPTQERMIGDVPAQYQIPSTFNFATRPKMWFGVWNGASSFSGSFSTAGKVIVPGTMPTGLTSRYQILGRRGGLLNRSWASHMVVFEMRFWSSALLEPNLIEQYAQLSSTWQFSSYG